MRYMILLLLLIAVVSSLHDFDREQRITEPNTVQTQPCNDDSRVYQRCDSWTYSDYATNK